MYRSAACRSYPSVLRVQRQWIAGKNVG
jgi:hypothetical protein